MTLQVARTIVQQRTDVLLPYARNSRTHSDAQVAQIAASIREFGFTNPVLVDGDNGMGHLAVERATRLAIDLARASGLAWVGVRNSNHAGAGGVYAAMAAAEGMVGL